MSKQAIRRHRRQQRINAQMRRYGDPDDDLRRGAEYSKYVVQMIRAERLKAAKAKGYA